jgi:hypothetical protein
MLDAYWGEGFTDATPEPFTHHTTGGSGTDVAGADHIFAGGRGTGAELGGDLIFQGSQAGGTGTTLRSLTELGRWDAETAQLWLNGVPGDDFQLILDAADMTADRTVTFEDDATPIALSNLPVSGADPTLTTGTAGTSGNCAEWNVDGDLVDSGGTCGGSGSPGGSTTEWQYRAGASTFGAIPGSSVDATNELITFAPTIDQATGDEVGFSLSPTFNKATSGDATALGITITDTASPGVLYLSEMEVTGGAKLDIRPEDGWGLTWTRTSAGGALNGPALFPEAASAANPNIVANRNDPDTGLGRAGVDIFTAVAGGTEGFSLWEGGWGSSAGDMVLELFDVTTAPTSNPAADDLLLYVDGDSLWIRKDDGTTVDLGASGAGMTSFNIDGDNNSPQTITDGNEALFVGGTNITTTAAVTDQVTIDLDLTGITDSQVLYDNSDALGGISQLTYDGTNLTLAPTSGDSVIAEEIIGEYYNNSGATIFKCAAVYISGFNVGADLPEISVADNDGAGTMPAVGILYADITNASAGFVVEFGNPVDLDTTVTEVWSAGDAVYVNASGTSTSADCSDTLTSTKPTGASNLIQKIGTVSRVNATNGSIEVSGAGRTNDVPNAIIIGTDDTINTDSVTLDNTWASAQLVATVVHDTESPTGGDVSGDFATGLVVADDSHNHVITNIDSFTVAELQTQTSNVDTFYTEDTVVPVADGGTGASSLTDGGILLGSGTGAVTALGVATNGQIPIGDGATDPVLATITGTANEITVTNGAGSITLDIPTSPTLDGTNFTGIPSSAITNEVRSMYWGAGAMSTDGTECTDPSELTINSGPKQFTVSCPHTTSETDGFVYGSTVLMDGFDQTADVTFELSAYIVTDSGAGTWHGEIAIQCQSAGEIIDSTWGTGIGLDLTPVGGDVAFDVIQDVSGAVDTDTTGEDCDAGDVLFWRWNSGYTDATASSGCTSSAGFENDMNLIGMKMEYTTNVGD